MGYASLLSQHRASITLVVLVLANLVPLFGVLRLDWDVGSIVVLYWAENLIIGFYTVIKLLLAAGVKGLFLVLFFIMHYGGFCGVHGFFVLSLTNFGGEQPALTPGADWPGPLIFPQMLMNVARQVLAAAPDALLWAVAALLLSHGVSFLLNYIGNRENESQTTNTIMTAPYKRIVVLHIAIIAGGFLVMSLGSPVGLLVALVALKIVMDIMLHRRSHRGRLDDAEAATQTSQS
ncbi:MAG: DUF6498-containing protein [Gammaproteobacteria bacterium]|nr:DUF6498-containing protein [Gammaproteobacteria bacterium]MDH3560727.1 DUF6498-containing protein [Gammaproteobacteria bacterium]